MKKDETTKPADSNAPADNIQVPEPTTTNLLEQTRAVVEELKKANEEKRTLLEREEKLRADELMHGRSQAGQAAPKEETPKEYAARVMRGGK